MSHWNLLERKGVGGAEASWSWRANDQKERVQKETQTSEDDGARRIDLCRFIFSIKIKNKYENKLWKKKIQHFYFF